MKLTNADLIRNREKALLETISGDLDLDSIRKLLEAKYRLNLDGDNLVCRDGDLVVHDNQVAYKVQFQAVVSLSLLFNRQGECLETDLFTALAEPEDLASETPDNGAYAAVSGRNGKEVDLPDTGVYDDIPASLDTAEDRPESGAYAYAYTYASPGRETGTDIPDNGSYGAVATTAGPAEQPSEDNGDMSRDVETAAHEEHPETPAEGTPPGGGEAPQQTARMASSIAEMISEINKT